MEISISLRKLAAGTAATETTALMDAMIRTSLDPDVQRNDLREF
jgi:hypothetical protein